MRSNCSDSHIWRAQDETLKTLEPCLSGVSRAPELFGKGAAASEKRQRREDGDGTMAFLERQPTKQGPSNPQPITITIPSSCRAIEALHETGGDCCSRLNYLLVLVVVKGEEKTV